VTRVYPGEGNAEMKKLNAPMLLRKKNVVFATQSLAELETHPPIPAILESCAIKIPLAVRQGEGGPTGTHGGLFSRSKKKLRVLALLLGAFPAIASADPLSKMQADAAALQQMATTWMQIESAAQSYEALAPYAAQEWAGQGPTVASPYYGGIEQCHNTHWDAVTAELVPGGMNIAGDAEAEAYAMQAVTVDFQEQLANYMTQEVQAGNSAVVDKLTAQQGPLLQSLHALSSLLNTTGNQIASAMGPSTALHPLPIRNWQAGIGNVPNLAAVRYVPGPNDGAPIGWAVPPTSQWAKLVDVCPTGTGSIPMLDVAAPVLSAAQVAIADDPDLASQIQPLENGSTFSLPAGGMPMLTSIVGLQNYQTRMELVSAIASDMQPLLGYMNPINEPLALYNESVQQILSEVDAQ